MEHEDHGGYVVHVHEIVESKKWGGDDTEDIADDSTSPFQEALEPPRKLRVHIRTSGAEPTDLPRFKVRMRSPKELGNESMRRLPKRRGAMLLLEMQAALEAADGVVTAV